jgi:iron complex transport system substrate-binding protein
MKLFPFILILLALTPLSCISPASNNPVSEKSTPAASTSATRVVALTSISADIISQLDATKLVGISGSRLLASNQTLKALPRVSEGRTQPNLEKIAALKPDLAIGAAGFHDGVLDKLKSIGVKTLTTKVDSWRSLEELTKTLATTIQANPEPLLQRYQKCSPNPTSNPGASTLVLVSAQPLLAPNKTSWAGDLLARLGAVNLAAELQGQSPTQGYVTLSPEKILQANPNILILVNVEGVTIEQFKSKPFWRDLKAVQNNRVYTLDYYGLVNPGSIDAILQACSQLKDIYSQNFGK